MLRRYDCWFAAKCSNCIVVTGTVLSNGLPVDFANCVKCNVDDCWFEAKCSNCIVVTGMVVK